ncbi:MAG: multidrug efflux SMR transporter [Deltaproteobacteria bacterium]|nr:multidrug efflux SMR transporter [Deltaproteobacteria bacterium]
MAYFYLAIGIILEVISTGALKASVKFTKLFPSAIVVIGYAASFYCFTLVLRTIPIGITYAIWSSLGIVLVMLLGIFLYKEIPDLPAVIGMIFIILGVIIINFFSKTIKR